MDIKNLLSHSEYIENESNELCCICYEQIEKNIICKKLCCGHKFHCKCIDIWLSDNYNCPICRHDFNQNQLNDNNNTININCFYFNILRISCLGFYVYYKGPMLFINGFFYGSIFGFLCKIYVIL